jgi:hypothetical protein
MKAGQINYNDPESTNAYGFRALRKKILETLELAFGKNGHG